MDHREIGCTDVNGVESRTGAVLETSLTVNMILIVSFTDACQYISRFSSFWIKPRPYLLPLLHDAVYDSLAYLDSE